MRRILTLVVAGTSLALGVMPAPASSTTPVPTAPQAPESSDATAPESSDAVTAPESSDDVSASATPWRTFSSDSYWNKWIPYDAPVSARSSQILTWLRDHSKTPAGTKIPWLRLSGVGPVNPDGKWGIPIYRTYSHHPVRRIIDDCRNPDPWELARVRIPAGAKPDPTSDGEMVVVDTVSGRSYGLWRARWDGTNWHSCWTSVYYNGSNGIAGAFYPSESNQRRNIGYRGIPPITYGVRRDEITAGRIPHVLKIATPTTCGHYFPMHDNAGCSDGGAPPQGTLIRIRPEVNLLNRPLSRAGRIIAYALQHFGAVVGERSVYTSNLKVENCIAEGKGKCWNNVLGTDALKSLPFTPTYWEVVKLGYRCKAHCGANP